MTPSRHEPRADRRRRVLVTGATGLLGGHLVPALAAGGWEVFPFGGPTREGGRGIDLGDRVAVEAMLARVVPAVVIHTAALAAAADCVADPARARRVNVEATANLAGGLRAIGGRLVHLSTDLVFDGERAPYLEDAPPAPVSIYGATKAEAETRALLAGDAVVVRTSLLFGRTRTERRGFFDAQMEAIEAGRPIMLFEDEWRTPLSLAAAAEALVAIADSDVQGTIHLGGPERMTRWEMGDRLARHLGRSSATIARGVRAAVTGGEPRPRDVSLDSTAFRDRFPKLATASFEEECVRMGIGGR
jgi:dTDP-4-dehydrorhamnose reductase